MADYTAQQADRLKRSVLCDLTHRQLTMWCANYGGFSGHLMVVQHRQWLTNYNNIIDNKHQWSLMIRWPKVKRDIEIDREIDSRCVVGFEFKTLRWQHWSMWTCSKPTLETKVRKRNPQGTARRYIMLRGRVWTCRKAMGESVTRVRSVC